MKKQLLSILFFLTTFALIAQDTQRIEIEGIIKVSSNEDLEGVSVYNVSSQKGTITNSEGKFSLEVAENDRIIFTALQFQEFTVVVDEGVVNEKFLSVYINPAVVELEEVVVRPYNLSGHVRVDAPRIRYVDINAHIGDLSYENLEFNSEFAPDSQTSIKENVSLEALGYTSQREGANIFGLVSLLSGNKSNKPTRRELTQLKEAKITAVQQRFGNHYFTDTLQIPEERIGEFLYFAEDEGLGTDLLKPENELKLMSFIKQKSTLFLALGED